MDFNNCWLFPEMLFVNNGAGISNIVFSVEETFEEALEMLKSRLKFMTNLAS